MAFAHYDPFWRQMRKLCVLRLFSRKRADSWDFVRKEVNSMVQLLTSNTRTAVNMGELVLGPTRDIIYSAVFGSSSHMGQDEFIKIL